MKLLISYVSIAQSIAVIIFHGAESITILKQQYHLSKIAILTKIFNHSYANKKKKAKFIFSLIVPLLLIRTLTKTLERLILPYGC